MDKAMLEARPLLEEARALVAKYGITPEYPPELGRWLSVRSGNRVGAYLTALTEQQLRSDPDTLSRLLASSESGVKTAQAHNFQRAVVGAMAPGRVGASGGDMLGAGLADTVIRTMWLMEGDKRYAVSAGLAEALAHTELRGMQGRHVQFPYKVFHVSIPRAAGLMILDAGDPALDWIAGAFLGEMFIGEVRVMAYSVYNHAATLDGQHPKAMRMSGHLPLVPNEVLVPHLSKLLDVAHHHLAGKLSKQAELGHMRWIFNLLVYLTSKDPEVSLFAQNREWQALTDRLKAAKGTKREKIKDQLKRHSPEWVYVVGASVKALDVRESLAKREGTPLTKRTFVKGFWRAQVKGPAITTTAEGAKVRIPAAEREHETIWVAPFWRGPVDGEVSNPVRIVL